MSNTERIAFFIGGALFGTLGVKALSGKDARRTYARVTAAFLRCRDEVMKDVELVQEGCSDILADAKMINEERRKELSPVFLEDGASR